ncbi:periplasmic binding protein-like I [Dissophora ornata]|nr:periplasmic binding protein-like I [Dissophora ornata]
MVKSAGQIPWILVFLGLILVICAQSVTITVSSSLRTPSFPGSLSKKHKNAFSNGHTSLSRSDHNKRQLQPVPAPLSSPIPASSAISPPYYAPLFYSDNAMPSIPRPPKKPSLLTDYEYHNHWDPQNNTLRLGVLLSLSTSPSDYESTTIRKAILVIRMAVNDVNIQKVIPGINMSIVLRDSQDPYFSTATRGAAALTAAGSLISAKVGGVIGDLASDLTKYEALMTSSVEIPQCSFASTNTMLSNTNLFRYFYRTIPTTNVLLDAVFEVIKHIGWYRVLFIYDSEALGWAGREYFEQKARNLGVTVLDYQPLNTGGVLEDSTYQAVKDSIKENQSLIHVLIATGPTQYNVLREMKNAGFVGPRYGWVTANDISDQIRMEPDASEYDGVIMVENGWDLKGYEPYENFLAVWMQLDPSDYPGAADPVLGHSEAEVYSCVMMMANVYGDFVRRTLGSAVNDLSPSSPFICEVISGNHTKDIDVPSYYQTRPYNGPSGPVTLDLNCDRKEGSLVVKNYRIYRIFNSVTVQSHVFKTRMLLSVVAMAVILSIIPMVVEVIIDTPLPTNINTRKYRWVSCKCARAPLIWYILSAIVPVLMVVFGAFLAFMTRNVAYLWNEARQIALVLYNVLIFTVIIIIAQAFPPDLYMVAFYMTIICTYATFLLALLVLFVPKFWRIFQANRNGNQQLTGRL